MTAGSQWVIAFVAAIAGGLVSAAAVTLFIGVWEWFRMYRKRRKRW